MTNSFLLDIHIVYGITFWTYKKLDVEILYNYYNMLSVESILEKLSELKDKVNHDKDVVFYISLIDLEKSRVVSTFHSSDIDDVIWYLSDNSLTSNIMTIQLITENEIGIILNKEPLLGNNIDVTVLESIMDLK